MIEQFDNTFADVTLFLNNCELPTATTSKLLRIVQDEPTFRKVKLEAAITVDAMKPFVRATYILEGDGPLALVAYQHLSFLYAHITTEHYPNVFAVAQHISGEKASRKQQAIPYAKACCYAAYSYFK